MIANAIYGLLSVVFIVAVIAVPTLVVRFFWNVGRRKP